MSILSGDMIKTLLKKNTWQCNVDYNSLHYNPNSVDVTLAKTFFRFDHGNPILCEYDKPEDVITIHPHEFVLGAVNERFIANAPYRKYFIFKKYFAQMLETRSTLARHGICVHISAGFGDYGFSGFFTLEIYNYKNTSVQIPIGSRIGQISFIEVLCGNKIPKKYNGYKQFKPIPVLPKKLI